MRKPIARLENVNGFAIVVSVGEEELFYFEETKYGNTIIVEPEEVIDFVRTIEKTVHRMLEEDD